MANFVTRKDEFVTNLVTKFQSLESHLTVEIKSFKYKKNSKITYIYILTFVKSYISHFILFHFFTKIHSLFLSSKLHQPPPHCTTTYPSDSHVTVDMEFAVTKSSSASTLSYIYLMCVIVYNLFIHNKSYKHKAPSTNLRRMMIVFCPCATATRKTFG